VDSKGKFSNQKVGRSGAQIPYVQEINFFCVLPKNMNDKL
jgi:hypothetical protein